MSIQKSLVSKLNISLTMLNEIYGGDFSVQSIAQTADIAAILSQASNGLSLKHNECIKQWIQKLVFKTSTSNWVFVCCHSAPNGQRIEFDKQTLF